MSDAKELYSRRTVQVSHNETLVRSWFDVEEHLIKRTIDVDGRVLDEETVDVSVIESRCDEEEEIVSTDEDTPDDEVVEEVFDEDEEN